MCGFAGVIAWDEKYRVRPETLARMSACIAHRGPDGEGTFLNHDAGISPDHPQVGMAFRRLAILDPDPRSNQPFVSPDGRYAMVFNGEIYNFRELKAELQGLRPDYQWRTTGDTEVLLVAYEVWESNCVDHLNGMFAFAVWDETSKTLFLARDRMGQKPLYVIGGTKDDVFVPTDLRMDQYGAFSFIAFASEPTALSEIVPGARSVETNAVEGYLRFGCSNWTVYAEIGCVDPGSTCAISATEVLDRVYFAPERFPPRSICDDEAVTQTRELVRLAVERRLVSDVPLGVLLSGGIDSSVVASCARCAGPVQTFSIGFDDPRYDETDHSVAVAKHLGTEHHVFRVTPHAAEDLPRLAAMFGTPFGDSSALPTHYLARETRKYVKVALSGDGGDELFGGYDRYRAMRWSAKFRALGLGTLSPLARLARGGHRKSKWNRAGRLLSGLALPAGERYESYLRLFDDTTLNELLQDTSPQFPAARLAKLFDRLHEGRDDVQTALAVDRITYLPDDLLTKIDRCSMLHALEVRSPFMDHELVEFAATLSTDQLLKGGPKRMLREAFAPDLPDFVFKRKKMGFAVPIGEWFRGELRSMLRDSLTASASFASSHFNMPVVLRLIEEHESGRVDHSQRLYALLMLELWWNIQRSS